MEIKVKVSPQFSDLLTAADLVDQLTELAAVADPETAAALSRDIKYRLRRMKSVEGANEPS